MAILLAAITLAVRLISPHTLFAPLVGLPVVQGLTGLTGLTTVIGAIRRRVSMRPPLYLVLQWVMLAWCVVTLVMNSVPPKRILGIKFINDMLFVTLVALVVDRLVRYKVLLAGYFFSLAFIAFFGVPQVWSPRLCGEIMGEAFDDVLWDTRPCQSDRMCEEKPPPRPGAPPERHFRCERRGPFDISSLLGRMRWVSVFTDPNSLASMCTTMGPLLLGWAWTVRRRRLIKIGLIAGTFGLLGAIIVATGSRGSTLGLLIGCAFTLWRFLGKKLIVIGAVLGIALGLQMTLSDKSLVQRGDENDLTGMQSSNKYRTAAMDVGMRLWGQYPIFGIGHNEIMKYHVLEAHNGYVSAASEVGSPGLFLFVFILWMNFRLAIAAYRRAAERGLEELRRWSLGVLGGLIGGTFSFTVFLTNYAT